MENTSIKSNGSAQVRPIETVGLIGLGAVGVLYAQRLLTSGARLLVIVDGERAARYRREGVLCNGEAVPFCYATPSAAKPVDLMIFATKIGGLRGAMETAADPEAAAAAIRVKAG